MRRARRSSTGRAAAATETTPAKATPKRKRRVVFAEEPEDVRFFDKRDPVGEDFHAFFAEDPTGSPPGEDSSTSVMQPLTTAADVQTTPQKFSLHEFVLSLFFLPSRCRGFSLSCSAPVGEHKTCGTCGGGDGHGDNDTCRAPERTCAPRSQQPRHQGTAEGLPSPPHFRRSQPSFPRCLFATVQARLEQYIVQHGQKDGKETASKSAPARKRGKEKHKSETATPEWLQW